MQFPGENPDGDGRDSELVAPRAHRGLCLKVQGKCTASERCQHSQRFLQEERNMRLENANEGTKH